MGPPYPSLTPALTNDQNKDAEKAPQGQRNNLKKIETLITGEIFILTIKLAGGYAETGGKSGNSRAVSTM